MYGVLTTRPGSSVYPAADSVLQRLSLLPFIALSSKQRGLTGHRHDKSSEFQAVCLGLAVFLLSVGGLCKRASSGQSLSPGRLLCYALNGH